MNIARLKRELMARFCPKRSDLPNCRPTLKRARTRARFATVSIAHVNPFFAAARGAVARAFGRFARHAFEFPSRSRANQFFPAHFFFPARFGAHSKRERSLDHNRRRKRSRPHRRSNAACFSWRFGRGAGAHQFGGSQLISGNHRLFARRRDAHSDGFGFDHARFKCAGDPNCAYNPR